MVKSLKVQFLCILQLLHESFLSRMGFRILQWPSVTLCLVVRAIRERKKDKLSALFSWNKSPCRLLIWWLQMRCGCLQLKDELSYKWSMRNHWRKDRNVGCKKQCRCCKILTSAAHAQAILDDIITPEFRYLFVRISPISGFLGFCLESNKWIRNLCVTQRSSLNDVVTTH